MAPPSPFQTPWYLQIFARHFIGNDAAVDLSFPFEKQGSNLILLGMRKVLSKEEVTDYGDADIDPALLLQKAKEMDCANLILDYVREDSHLHSFFSHNANAIIEKQEVSPYIQLPTSWDAYLTQLDGVERKELKRKLKRLDTIPHTFTILPSSDETVFTEFIRMHKLSDSNKEKFMSAPMEQFFHDLAFIEKQDWKSYFAVLKIEDKPAAAILFFEQGKRALLYNSGFDPVYKFYSNGLMLHALLIQRNIENGFEVHDFLRGNERYKYDLGAKDLNLYKISITLK